MIAGTFVSERAKPLFVHRRKTAEQALCGTFPTVTLAGGYSVYCIEHPIGCVVA
jgi:hypothetical protein